MENTLRQLARQSRQRAEQGSHTGSDEFDRGKEQAWESCADDREELLDQHTERLESRVTSENEMLGEIIGRKE